MHTHDHGPEDTSESPSTGFLPMALAGGLFVIGLFALGYVRCEPAEMAPGTADENRHF